MRRGGEVEDEKPAERDEAEDVRLNVDGLMKVIDRQSGVTDVTE